MNGMHNTIENLWLMRRIVYDLCPKFTTTKFRELIIDEDKKIELNVNIVPQLARNVIIKNPHKKFMFNFAVE